MITATIDIRHDGIEEKTYVEYSSELVGLVDEQEKIIERKIYNFINELLKEYNDWYRESKKKIVRTNKSV